MADEMPRRPADLPWGTLAWCRVTCDGVVGELLQTRDGCLVRTFNDDASLPVARPFAPTQRPLDLIGALDELRTTTLPANNDPRRGSIAALELVAGDRFVRLRFQRPLSTTPYRSHSVLDRIQRAIFGWPT